MWIILLIIIALIITGFIIFKFLQKKKDVPPLNLKINESNIHMQEKDTEKKPLKRPLKTRKEDSTVEEIKEETGLKEEKITAKSEILDLDDLFKTISLKAEENDDFDFGLKNSDKQN